MELVYTVSTALSSDTEIEFLRFNDGSVEVETENGTTSFNAEQAKELATFLTCSELLTR